jgi:glycosyltransferase involved in cell wall biosynthesis
VKSKGFSDLIEAAAGLSGRYSFMVAIAGDGPERMALERQAVALGIADRVNFLGWVGDLRAQMRQSDVFVFPSHYEGFPNSVLEAMAASRPVITSFWGADAKILHTTGCVRGYLPGDVAALSTALAEVFESETLSRSLADHGLRHVRGHAVETVVGEYDTLFRDLLHIAA